VDVTLLLNVAIIGVLAIVLTHALMSRGRRGTDEDILRRLDGQADGKKRAPKHGSIVLDQKDSGIDNVAKVLAKPLEGSDYERNRLSLLLAQAGYRGEKAVFTFLAVKITMAVVGLVVGLVLYKFYGPEEAPWHKIIMYPLGGLCFGFFAPQFWLSSAASSRSDKITRALPDALDMLTIMVEAGLGLDAGIQRCADEMRKPFPEIAEELMLSSRETQLGLKRSEALSKMAKRTGVKEMQALVAMLTQAERFGTSIATGLRVHAQSLRTKRRQKAEEAAGKVATKLVFPLILFIFPTIFIVTVGPAAFQIAGMFSSR